MRFTPTSETRSAMYEYITQAVKEVIEYHLSEVNLKKLVADQIKDTIRFKIRSEVQGKLKEVMSKLDAE